MIRNNQAFISNEFARRGCELLDVYRNRCTPVKFRCRCGKLSEIRYSSFQRGSYCQECGGKKKHTLGEIQDEFKKKGCLLLDDHYQDARTKMNAICQCGRKFQISWNNLQQGKRCRQCGVEKNRASISGDKHYAWIPDRKEAKLRRTISARCRAHLRRALKTIGTTKQDKTYKMLGYTARELQEHIISHPNWNSIKDGDWHLDHIFPVKAFNDHHITDPAIINALDNLQPIEGPTNRRKTSKYNSDDFGTWLQTKGCEIV